MAAPHHKELKLEAKKKKKKKREDFLLHEPWLNEYKWAVLDTIYSLFKAIDI